MPTIRPATSDDAEAISAIYNDAVATTSATFHTEPESVAARAGWLAQHGPRHPVLAAEEDGLVVGWAALSQFSDRPAYVDTAEISVYVQEACRGRGIGTGLVSAVLEAGRPAGLHTVLSRIAEGNPASVRLHEKAGFKHVGTMREVGLKFGQRLGVHIMELIYPEP